MYSIVTHRQMRSTPSWREAQDDATELEQAGLLVAIYDDAENCLYETDANECIFCGNMKSLCVCELTTSTPSTDRSTTMTTEPRNDDGWTEAESIEIATECVKVIFAHQLHADGAYAENMEICMILGPDEYQDRLDN